jgi:hypothetical protein
MPGFCNVVPALSEIDPVAAQSRELLTLNGRRVAEVIRPEAAQQRGNLRDHDAASGLPATYTADSRAAVARASAQGIKSSRVA